MVGHGKAYYDGQYELAEASFHFGGVTQGKAMLHLPLRAYRTRLLANQ